MRIWIVVVAVAALAGASGFAGGYLGGLGSRRAAQAASEVCGGVEDRARAELLKYRWQTAEMSSALLRADVIDASERASDKGLEYSPIVRWWCSGAGCFRGPQRCELARAAMHKLEPVEGACSAQRIAWCAPSRCFGTHDACEAAAAGQVCMGVE